MENRSREKIERTSTGNPNYFSTTKRTGLTFPHRVLETRVTKRPDNSRTETVVPRASHRNETTTRQEKKQREEDTAGRRRPPLSFLHHPSPSCKTPVFGLILVYEKAESMGSHRVSAVLGRPSVDFERQAGSLPSNGTNGSDGKQSLESLIFLPSPPKQTVGKGKGWCRCCFKI